MAAPTLSTSTDIDNETKIKILMVECYWYYRRSLKDVKARIIELCGRSVLPTDTTIKRRWEKFHDHGTVSDLKRTGRPRSVTNSANIEIVREFFEENRKLSIRRAGERLGMAATRVRRILRKELKFFPYKIQIHQYLTQWDMDRRDRFAFRMDSWIIRGKLNPQMIWFSDECHFWLNGFVNKQNYRFWAGENPRVFEVTKMKPEKVTVWCAISAKGIIGPFFFNDTVNSERYKEMLEDFFIPSAQGLDAIDDFWFMQDGAKPHRTLEVFELLDEHFHGRVIGLEYESRYGCGIEWPPCSPDLNPCDYYLWGSLKEKVYASVPTTVQELKDKVIEELGKITTDEFQRVIGQFEKRLKKVQDENGAHIEQYHI